MHEAEWQTRKQPSDARLRANVDRPLWSLSASTGERVRVRCRFRIRPSRIREIRNRPHPKVVVTGDMLTTDVDLPALEFIVFLRPVRSRILWVQMLGRGTRKSPDLNKSKFLVFDCFEGTLIRYLQNTSDFEIEPPGKTPLTLPEIIENIWQNVDVRDVCDLRIRTNLEGTLSLGKKVTGLMP